MHRFFSFSWRVRGKARLAVCCIALLGVSGIGELKAAIPASERAVLEQLYARTDGDRWLDNSGWNGASGTECSWHGIVCAPIDGIDHVTEIYLDFNRLAGTLPALGELSQLQIFIAYGNGLRGKLPPFDGLGELFYFDVFANQLEGPIPDLGPAPNLRSFDVSINFLTGPIPDLSGVARMGHFDVESNRLSGTVPSLAALTNLRRFNIGGNRLGGAMPPPPSPNDFLLGGARLCTFSAGRPERNFFTPAPSEAWDIATRTRPWHAGCTSEVIFASGFDD